MKPISLKQLLRWIPHATLSAKEHVSLEHTTSYGVNTDTRTLRAGNCFVALVGDHFDGHRFLQVAHRQKAAVIVANFDAPELGHWSEKTPVIRVPDTGKALQALAKGYRQQFHISLTVVVGSNGKTTVKEMIHSIFKMHCAVLDNERSAHCTVGNFNNEIGLPLTLLRLNEHHRYSTVELGMNHPGETALLAAIAAPTIALINNAQREHQEFMHTVEAVAHEHAAVIAHLVHNGIAVLPAQDAHCDLWRSAAQQHQKRIIDFALHSEQDHTPAAITGTRSEQGLSQTLTVHTPAGGATVLLSTAGEHNARNALAAVAVAISAGVPLDTIVAGLQAFEPVKGRMQQHRVNGQVVIDDTYNANPDSVAAATRVLAQQGLSTALVLGDMGEVGDQGEAFHREAGLDAAQQGVGAVYTLGALSVHAHTAFLSSGRACQHFSDAASLHAFLASGGLANCGTVLVKGSRFMRMEMAVEALLGQSTATAGEP